jgi:hypothetical protein
MIGNDNAYLRSFPTDVISTSSTLQLWAHRHYLTCTSSVDRIVNVSFNEKNLIENMKSFGEMRTLNCTNHFLVGPCVFVHGAYIEPRPSAEHLRIERATRLFGSS